ncbi:MAG: hypothetical protein MI924_01665 [Chloroflexales bacterium]|nr:hypothetical protein [Chloroflexales bacterium]
MTTQETNKGQRNFRISGHVIDQFDLPVAGIRVEAWDSDWRADWHTAWGSYDDFVGSYTTNQDGSFQITFREEHYRELEPDRWPDIYFKLYRGNTLLAQPHEILCNLREGDTEVRLTVALPQAAGTITGTCYYDTSRQGDEQGVDGVLIKLSPHDPRLAKRGEWTRTTYTDGGGRFKFSSLPPGKWLLEPQPIIDLPPLPRLKLGDPSYAAIIVPVSSGLTLELPGIGYEVLSGAVHGIVFYDQDGSHMPDKNPRLRNVRVFLHNLSRKTVEETATDAQGAFNFDDPTPGYYYLSAEPTLDASKFGLGKGKLHIPSGMGQNHARSFYTMPGEDVQHNIGYIGLGSDIRGLVFRDDDASGQFFGQEPGISGVPVVLITAATQATIDQAYTNHHGEFFFRDVPPAHYRLTFTDTIWTEDGEELSLTTPAVQSIRAVAGETVQAAPTGYQPELHEIRGLVEFDDGSKVVGLVVTLCDEAGNEVDTTVTDDQGNYAFKDKRGTFVVKFPDPPFEGQILTPKQRLVEANSIANVGKTRYRRTPLDGFGDGRGADALQTSVADLAAYPVLTEGAVSSPIVRAPSAGARSLGQTVEVTLREVLGWRPKRDDPKAFLAALAQSFSCEEIEGRTQCKWTPRSYAIQADLGAITGAQASIHARAKAALDQSLPLLDGLYPLLSTADKEDSEAARAIVRSHLSELVNELGMQGGPRVQRVDTLFAILGADARGNPETVGGQLGNLRKEFGLKRLYVNTVEEERNLTNFFILVDHVNSLKQSWDIQRDFFDREGDDVFLGTQLVLLSRSLAVVAEAVREVYYAMDSVFLDAAERQTIRLDFCCAEEPALFVAELLDWVDTFASKEGPYLIQEAGKAGVAALLPTVQKLHKLVRAARIPPQDAYKLPAGYRTTRVQRALGELEDHLGEAARLIEQLASEA